MPLNREQVLQDILERIGQEELARVESLIGSTTLRTALELLVDANEGQAHLFIPHYWAEFYHDGRGSVVPVDARFLVYFTNPADDPRLAGGYPERVKDIIRLTKDQWEEGLAINAERRASGGPPYMIVVPRVGPAAPHPFFDELAEGASERATPLVLEVFNNAIQDLIDNDPDLRPETLTAEFDL